ncbi:hypothetical protein B0H16DRAFT_1612539 [Mycena metata]|uniref:Uncharacterized protein n=1 Tax=Mycena metata TaxID=1033252 RepID=A0AAD7HCW8_9AGAR|nr:hypothetical protein B0H16DRAFT_1612539 [Mycena metata]
MWRWIVFILILCVSSSCFLLFPPFSFASHHPPNAHHRLSLPDVPPAETLVEDFYAAASKSTSLLRRSLHLLRAPRPLLRISAQPQPRTRCPYLHRRRRIPHGIRTGRSCHSWFSSSA